MTFIQRVQTTLAFAQALITGSASFSITLGGVKHTVTLTNNGKPSGPNPALLPTVISALITQTAVTTVRIGNNDWTVTVV